MEYAICTTYTVTITQPEIFQNTDMNPSITFNFNFQFEFPKWCGLAGSGESTKMGNHMKFCNLRQIYFAI